MLVHLAFAASLEDVLGAPRALRSVGITPLDFYGQPTDEPVVLSWIPAASVYSAILTVICSSTLRCWRTFRATEYSHPEQG
jgi:lactoylglutathione lyase